MTHLMSRRLKVALAASITAAVVIVFIALPAYMAYASLHPPRCIPENTPSDYGIPYLNFTVTASDGIRISGWILNPNATREPVFILLHGYTSCRYSHYMKAVANELAKRGYTVVVFDFRGHGLSGGQGTTIGPSEVRDVRAVIEYVERRYHHARVALVGFSMGGALAIVVGAMDPRVSCIVADSPYYRLAVVVPRWVEKVMELPAWYASLIQFYGQLMSGVDLSFGPAEVHTVEKPLLVVYGTRDPLLTLTEAKEIASKSPWGRVLVVEGAEHVRAYSVLGIDKYVDEVLRTCKAATGAT